MDFTTTTDIARKGSKSLMGKKETIILNNNKMLGLYLPGDLGQAVLDSGIITQIREEMRELNDKETVDTIKKYKSGDKKDMITLDDYRKKYGI